MWNTRMTSSISGISPLREFCLNDRIYNIPSKIRVNIWKERIEAGIEFYK